jgi:hypothetical protein
MLASCGGYDRDFEIPAIGRRLHNRFTPLILLLLTPHTDPRIAQRGDDQSPHAITLRDSLHFRRCNRQILAPRLDVCGDELPSTSVPTTPPLKFEQEAMNRHKDHGGECFIQLMSSTGIYSDVSRLAKLCRDKMWQDI